MQLRIHQGSRWRQAVNASPALLLWVLLLAMGGTTGRAQAQGTDAALVNQPWFEIRSAGFWAYSCGRSQEVFNLVARLEQFRFCYAQLGGTQAVAAPPITVYAFPNDASYVPFKPLYDGRPANISGCFMRRPEGIMIALSLSRTDAGTLQTMYHEYTHFLLRNNQRFWPMWLKEGMADLYSTLAVSGGTVSIGLPSGPRLYTLAHQELMPLHQLLSVTHESPAYNERDQQGIFYAQSWLLAHYLAVANTPHHDQFPQYTRLLRTGMGPVPAFTSAFKTSLPAMERELRGYLARSKFEPATIRTSTQLAALQAVITRKLTPGETAFMLGKLLLQTGRDNDAGRYFEMAKRLQPNAPYGYEGLGMLAGERENSRLAVQQLEQAVQLGARNYSVYYQLGHHRLFRTEGAGGTFQRLPPEQAQEIRSCLEKSIQMMPSFARSQYFLGFLELIQEDDLAAAERHLQAAMQLEPDVNGYALTLAQVQIARQQFTAARELLQELTRTATDDHHKTRAAALLAKIAKE
ncbi:MAG: tetratricopeptide repeat protein [Verrucomicrobiota bacterium]